MNLKKIFLIVCLIFMIIPKTAFADTPCNQYASKGKSECVKHSYQGYKCAWDGNKKGGGRCYKSDKKGGGSSNNSTTGEDSSGGTTDSDSSSESTNNGGSTGGTSPSCTSITSSDTCRAATRNGYKCIWRQGSCYNGTYSGDSDGGNSNQITGIPADIKDFLDKIDGDYNSKCQGNLDSDTCRAWQAETYNKLVEYMDYCQKVYSNLDKDDTSQEYVQCKNLYDFIENWSSNADPKPYFGNRIIASTGSGTCDDTLGSLGVWLTKIYKLMLLLLPVVVVIMGFKDFIQAFTTGKDDELKKCGSTFIKRLILGAIFVALPMLIKVILTVALGGNLANICIL